MATTKSMPMSMSSPLCLSGGSMPSSPAPTCPPPPRSPSSSISQHSHTKSSILSQPFSPKSSSSCGGEDTKFRLSKLLQLHHYHHSHNHQGCQKRPEYGQEGTTHPQRPSRQHPQSFSSKHRETRFKERNHRGGFLGFLQSHYHVFHRHTDSAEKDVKERERKLADISVRQSPGGSFISAQSKSPQNTVHSAYNVTISDFRAHATIGSTRSSGSPKNVTDIIFERRAFDPMTSSRGALAQDSDGQCMISPPISSSISPSPNGARSINPSTPRDDLRDTGVFRSPFRSLGMLNLASSPSSSVSPLPLPSPPSISKSPRLPPSPSFGALVKTYDVEPREWFTNTSAVSPSSPRSPGHERCDQMGSVSSKTSSRWGMSAKLAFMNLKKKRSMLPSHYLSLPVGGSTSSANGLYMLHSEDLSVTEFAKLAGITILSEDDTTDTRAQEELANGGEGDGQGHGQGQDGPEPGHESAFDSGDTINSDRHPTFNSITSDSSFRRKFNIWEPQFWTMPSREGSTGTHTPLNSASTTSLPIQTAPSTPRTSERRGSYRSENVPSVSPGSSRRVSITSSSSGVLPSSVLVRAPPIGSRIGSHNTQTVGPSLQERRNSCSPGLILTSLGQKGDRSRPSSGSTKRDYTRSSKEVQFSRNLGRRRSFSSLTAIAIELDSDYDLKTRAQSSLAPDEPKPTLCHSNLQNSHHPATATTEAAPNILLETSNPPKGLPGSHSLQNSPRMRGHHLPSFGSSLCSDPGTKTRSPSPSPLSRQIGVSRRSEGDDHDQNENTTSMSRKGQEDHSREWDQAQDRGVVEAGQGELEGKGQGYRQHVDTEMPGPLLLHNRTSSLPLLLSDPNHKPLSQGAVHPAAGPPNSSPSRLLVPGMRVGRFTLVQEMCTKHVDILKAQQEQELQVQRGSPDNQAHGPSPSSGQVFPSLKKGPTPFCSSSSEGGPGEYLEATRSDGSWLNPMLRPEENVMVFQRKKARRLVTPSQLVRQDPSL